MISKLLTSTLLLISIFCSGQELFSDAFQGNIPFSILSVEEDLYVGIFIRNSERELGIYKISTSDPSNIEQVVDITAENPVSGILNMAYDSSTNAIIAPLSTGLIKVSLNQSFPGSYENFYDSYQGGAGGAEITAHNGLIYFEDVPNVDSEISKISTEDGSTPMSLYISENQEIIVPVEVYNNELYFFERDENGKYNLFKISLSEGNNTPVLVSNSDIISEFPTSTHVLENTLYIGLDGRVNQNDINSLIALDLTQSYPIEPNIVLEHSNDGVIEGITSVETTLYFTTFENQNINSLDISTLIVSDNVLIDVSIYPNPATDILFIESSINDPLEFKIIDVLGKKLKEGIYTNDGISLSNLSKGMYFLTLNTKDNSSSFTYKFLKN